MCFLSGSLVPGSFQHSILTVDEERRRQKERVKERGGKKRREREREEREGKKLIKYLVFGRGFGGEQILSNQRRSLEWHSRVAKLSFISLYFLSLLGFSQTSAILFFNDLCDTFYTTRVSHSSSSATTTNQNFLSFP